MKKILLLFLLFLVGCDVPPSRKVGTKSAPKFEIGQKVILKVNKKTAIITDVVDFATYIDEYRIRFANDLGELQVARVYEYELEEE